MSEDLPVTFNTKPPSAEARTFADKDLVAEVLLKDRKATAEFVSRFADRVYGYVRRRLIPHTEFVDDLVQEVFLAAWENLDKFRGDSSLSAWILGIARHKVEDYYRRRLVEAVTSGEEDQGSEPDPAEFRGMEELLDRKQAQQKARRTLASLPEAYSAALAWRYWERRSVREIAGQTGKTEKAIERLLARARAQFKKKWNE